MSSTDHTTNPDLDDEVDPLTRPFRALLVVTAHLAAFTALFAILATYLARP